MLCAVTLSLSKGVLAKRRTLRQAQHDNPHVVQNEKLIYNLKNIWKHLL